MAILTIRHHVAEALRFYNAADMFVGIGHTTPWPNDSSPPAPMDTVEALVEPIGYKPVSTRKLLIPDEAGLFPWAGQNWTEVLEVDARDEKAIYVYIESRMEYDELPLVSYREVGIFTGLVKAGGAGSGALLPGEVTDPGDLEYLDYRQPEPRAIDKVDTIGVILRF